MGIEKYEGRKFLDTPFPVWYVRPFYFLYNKFFNNKEIKPLSDKALRITLAALAVAALFVIWMLEGFINPLTLLVDIPLYDFNDSVYGAYTAIYMIMTLTLSALLMKLIDVTVCRKREIKLFSVDGILLWLVGASVGIAADTMARWFMDTVCIPYYENTPDANLTAGHCIMMLVFNGALFFILNDTAATMLSMFFTPIVSAIYIGFVPADSFFGAAIIRQLIITFVLTTVVTVLMEKTSIIDKAMSFIIKYLYTPRYIPITMMWMTVILIPVYLKYKKAHPKKTS